MSSQDLANAPIPSFGALLGLDYGTKRLGIAVSNSEQTIAAPVETWNVRTPQRDLKHLKELIDDYRVVGIVVGLPVRLNGVEGDKAAEVRRYGDGLAAALKLPVRYWDERYSSMEAEVLLWTQGLSPTKNKQRVDRLAAHVILQSYLDAPDRNSPPAPL